MFTGRRKHLAQFEGVDRGCAFLVVIKVDVNVSASCTPRPYLASPIGKCALRIVAFVAPSRTMTAYVNEIGSPPPWRRRIMVIGQAKRNIAFGQHLQNFRRVPTRIAKFKAVAPFVRQHLEEVAKPLRIGLEVQWKLKKDRTDFIPQKRCALFQQFETVD